MQELEKILEEIEQKKCEHIDKDYIFGSGDIVNGLDMAMEIIRKHMNDDWISVDERLPNGGIDVEVTVRRGYRTIGYYNELYEEWYSTDESGLIDVIAWKEPSEPYRPERSEE